MTITKTLLAATAFAALAACSSNNSVNNTADVNLTGDSGSMTTDANTMGSGSDLNAGMSGDMNSGMGADMNAGGAMGTSGTGDSTGMNSTGSSNSMNSTGNSASSSGSSTPSNSL